MLVRRAMSAAAAAGLQVPRMWLSGELPRRGALRRLPFVLLEKLDAPSPLPPLASSLCVLPADTPGLSSGLPRYDDAFALLTELRRIAIACGATELDAPLARLETACKAEWAHEPSLPHLLLHREGLNPPPVLPAPAGGTATAAVELEATPAPAGADDLSTGCGSYAPWASVAVGLGDPNQTSAIPSMGPTALTHLLNGLSVPTLPCDGHDL